jgi:multidrug efflux pump subunit AcrA (membrane-fusion protein)
MREVQVGQFNDEFIEIQDGLAEGDRVSLRAPPEIDTDGGPTQDEEQAPQTPPAVAVL